MRLVHGNQPAAMTDLVVAHIRKQGYFVVENRAPTDAERLAHPLLARVDRGRGSAAPRTSMDEPMTRSVVTALTRSGVCLLYTSRCV